MTTETLLNLEDHFKKFYLSNQREFKISVNEEKFSKIKVANELAKLAKKYYDIGWQTGISKFGTKIDYYYENIIIKKTFKNSNFCTDPTRIIYKGDNYTFDNIIYNFFRTYSGKEFNFSSKDENYTNNMLNTIKKTIDDNNSIFKINVENSEGKENFCGSLESFLRSSLVLSKNDYNVVQKCNLNDLVEKTQFNKFKCEFMFYPYK